MLPLQITITPTMLTFKELSDELANEVHDKIGIKWNEKGYYYLKGNPQDLYKALLTLSYTYDMEII